jgi:maltose O-acetyltransferase
VDAARTVPDPDPGAGDLTHKERMLAGLHYRASDPELAAEFVAAQERTAAYNALGPADLLARDKALRELFARIGEGCEVRAGLQVDCGSNITVGDRVFINFGAYLADIAAITIGDDTLIGANVSLLTPTHPTDARLRLAKWEGGAPIAIGRNVWLGGNVTVCPGVSIGDDTTVGAGSVVVRDLPAGVVAVGNPARVVRELPPAERTSGAVAAGG